MLPVILTLLAVQLGDPASVESWVDQVIHDYWVVEKASENELKGVRVGIDPLAGPAGGQPSVSQDVSLLTGSYLYHFVLQGGGTPVLTRSHELDLRDSTATPLQNRAALLVDTGCSIWITLSYRGDPPSVAAASGPANHALAEQLRRVLGGQTADSVTEGSVLSRLDDARLQRQVMAGCEVRMSWPQEVSGDGPAVRRRCLRDARRIYAGLVAYYRSQPSLARLEASLSGRVGSDAVSPVPSMPTSPMEFRWAKMGRSIWPAGRLPAERLEWFCRMWTRLSISNRSLVHFDVTPSLREGVVELHGAANTLRPIVGLEHALRTVGFTELCSQVRALPDRQKLGEQLFGVCRTGAVLTVDRPSPRGDMQSQLLMGEPVFLLDRDQGYLLVQGGVGYWGWVPDETIERMTGRQFDAYRKHRVGVMLDDISRSGWTWPRGSRVPVIGTDGRELVVLTPGGSTWALPAETMQVDDNAAARAYARVRAALEMLYAPYIFGGRSPTGLDCSGLITNVWTQAGVEAARDAWQQAMAGSLVATAWHRSGIRAGDQLFFIDQSGKIHHTGIAIDATHLVHASPPCVQIASIQKGDRLYDAGLDRSFFMAKRP